MKTLGHVLLTQADSTGTHVRVEPIQIASVQIAEPHILLEDIALGNSEVSAVQSAQPIDLQEYTEPEKPKLDGVKFSQRKFSSLALVRLPWFSGTSKWRDTLTDDPGQAARDETLALLPIDSTVQSLPAGTQVLGLFNTTVYQLSATDIATKHSTQLGFVVPGTEQPNWATIAHNLKRRWQRDADELRRLEPELAPTPTLSVKAEEIEPDLTLVAGPDAKYEVKQLKRLHRGSILKTVEVADGYLVEDPEGKLPEARKYVSSFKQDLISRDIDVKHGMEREFFPELFV